MVRALASTGMTTRVCPMPAAFGMVDKCAVDPARDLECGVLHGGTQASLSLPDAISNMPACPCLLERDKRLWAQVQELGPLEDGPSLLD